MFIRQAIIFIILSVAILMGVIRFGIPWLVKLASILGDLRSNKDTTVVEDMDTMIAPTWQFLPEATNSANLVVSGYAQEKTKVIVFLNSNPLDEETLEPDNSFKVEVKLREGDNRLWAISRNQKNQESQKSAEKIVVLDDQPPQITIDSPQDNDTATTKELTVNGIVDEDTHLTVNDRLVNQKSDGSFSQVIPLSEGENTITIVARDPAGNESTKTIKVTYSP